MTSRPDPRNSALPALWLGGIFLLCAGIAVAATRMNDGVALLWPGNAIVAAGLIRMLRVHWPATRLVPRPDRDA